MPSVMHCKLIGAERVFPLPSMKKERSGFARHNIVKQLLFELIDCRLPTRPILITSQKNVIVDKHDRLPFLIGRQESRRSHSQALQSDLYDR